MKFLRKALFLHVAVLVPLVSLAATLKINFSGMNPHVGQKLELRVVDKGTRMEIGRVTMDAIANPDFSVEVDGIEAGKSYWIDFYADFNKNGKYDAPGDDHAWRLELNDAQGDTTLNFSHNLNFTDIRWPYLLTVNFQNMNPHVGQKFELRVVELGSGMEVGRRTVDAIAGADFSVQIPGIMPGNSYDIDFYADFNQNGLYDRPSDDHAWRITLESVSGDTTVDFSHNTNFTDIDWVYLATLDLMNMNPHLGQQFEVRLINLYDFSEVGRYKLAAIDVPNFQVAIPGVMPGGVYRFEFYADFNKNGAYDSPPDDHAWREEFTAMGDATVAFTHNIDFTDIGWNYLFTLNLMNMNPHLGQQFELRVVRSADGKEVGRVRVPAIRVPNFSVSVPGIMTGETYKAQYYADFNKNGLYDAPPDDHAWEQEFTASGDTEAEFTHNINFTDINWAYLFTLHLKNMKPHLGQLFELRVVDQSDEREIGRVSVSEILLENFAVHVPGFMLNRTYRVDYYADFSKNGQYDAPPTDHAWRQTFTSDSGDVQLEFTHNVNFTDIQWPGPTGVEIVDELAGRPESYALLQNYPNPFNPATIIRFEIPEAGRVQLFIYNTMGQVVRRLVDRHMQPGRYQVVWDGTDDRGRILSSGLYFYTLQTGDYSRTLRMLFMK